MGGIQQSRTLQPGLFGFIRQRVYVQLFIALALGSGAAQLWPPPRELLVGDALLIALLLAALAVLWWVWYHGGLRLAHLPGYALLAAVGFAGASVAIALPLSATLRAEAGSTVVLYGEVVSLPKYQRGHLRFMLRATEVEKDRVRTPVNGQCYAYLRCDEPVELYLTDDVRLYAQLREIEPPRNRGQFDYRRYLLQRGTVLTAYAATPKMLRRLTQRPPPVWSALARLRVWLTGTLACGLPADYGELAISVVYGDKITDLPSEMEERFRRAGLTHILVASGTQVSLLIVLLALLCWKLPDDFTWRGLLINLGQFSVTLLVVLVYAAVTGLETSILRALVMGVLVMAGRLAYRQVDGLTALAQSGIILLIVNPLQLLAPGFQLSFGATFGLIYVAGIGFPLVALWRGWRRWVAQMLLTTGGAQLFVAPVLACHFQQLSCWGLFSNLVAIPLSFAMLITGAVASIGLVHVPLIGTLLRWALLAMAWLLDGIARVFSALPLSDLAVPHPPWWWLLTVYGLVLLAGEWVKCRQLLDPRLRALLRVAVPAAAMLPLACALHWLLVPAPGLVALNLPRCEAYIWRPYSGRTVLLLRSSGLDQQHNADAVVAALRYRGINRLHGIVWLDGDPGEDALPDYDAAAVALGCDVDPRWDLGWLPATRGSPAGARLALGSDELWIVWDARLDEAALPPASTSATEGVRQPTATVMTKAMFDTLSEDQRHALAERCGQLVVLTDTRDPGVGSLVSCAGEVSLRPGRFGTVVECWEAHGP